MNVKTLYGRFASNFRDPDLRARVLALAGGKFVGRKQVEHGRAGIAEAGALKRGRQEAVRVIEISTKRAGIEEQDVAGEVLVRGAEAIKRPGADGRAGGREG